MLSGLRLQGRLDVQALADSLDTIVRRHEALRTSFATTEDTPVQIIHPAAPMSLWKRRGPL